MVCDLMKISFKVSSRVYSLYKTALADHFGSKLQKSLMPLLNGGAEARYPGAVKYALWLFMLSVWWCTAASLPFWKMSLSPLAENITGLARFGLATMLCLVFAHTTFLLIISALMPAIVSGALITLMGLAAAIAFAFSSRYHAAITPEMIENAVQTNTSEALDLLTLPLLADFLIILFFQIPILIRIIRAKTVIKTRFYMVLLAIVSFVSATAALFTNFSGIAIYMRDNHGARYFITPSNVVSSSIRTLTQDASSNNIKREIIDKAPVLSQERLSGRPVVVVTVVGETARAKNWGLSGYSRETTPELFKRDVINFTDVSSCGTSTAVSVPCVFSLLPGSSYDKQKALAMEQLPALVSRAGVKSMWIDNQAGSKGAADGIEEKTLSKVLPAQISKAICPSGACPDMALVRAVRDQLSEVKGPSALYLHMMGSHGPAYADRYPPSFQRWGPVCRENDLRQCQLSELRNAYDNTILYTDSVLSGIIDTLKARKDLDSAFIYFSDHGESLGDDGFFLHGAPYAIAPAAQKKVPMVMWFSDGYVKRTGLDKSCLLKRAASAVSHDNIYHTLLDLNAVRSKTYDSSLDLLSGCINPSWNKTAGGDL